MKKVIVKQWAFYEIALASKIPLGFVAYLSVCLVALKRRFFWMIVFNKKMISEVEFGGRKKDLPISLV